MPSSRDMMKQESKEQLDFDRREGYGDRKPTAAEKLHTTEQNLESLRRELQNARAPEVRRVLTDEYNRVDNELRRLKGQDKHLTRGGVMTDIGDTGAAAFGEHDFFEVERTEKTKDGRRRAFYNGGWHEVEKTGKKAATGKPMALLGKFAPSQSDQAEYGWSRAGGTTAAVTRGVAGLATGESLKSQQGLRKIELGQRYPEVANTPYAGGRTATVAGGAIGALTDPLSYVGLRAGPLGMTGVGALSGGMGEAADEAETGRNFSAGKIALGSLEGATTMGLMGAGGRMIKQANSGGIAADRAVDKILRERFQMQGGNVTGGSVKGPDIGQAPENVLDKPIALDSTPIKTPANSQKVKQPLVGPIVNEQESNLDDVLPHGGKPTVPAPKPERPKPPPLVLKPTSDAPRRPEDSVQNNARIFRSEPTVGQTAPPPLPATLTGKRPEPVVGALTLEDIYGTGAKATNIATDPARAGEIVTSQSGGKSIVGMSMQSRIRMRGGKELDVTIGAGEIWDGGNMIDASLVEAFKNRGAGAKWIPVRKARVEPAVGALPEQPPGEFPPIRLDEPVAEVREFPPIAPEPATPAPAATPAPSELGLTELGGGAKAITDNMYSMLYEKFRRGETLEAGKQSVVLQVMKKIGAVNRTLSPEQFKSIAQKITAIGDEFGREGKTPDQKLWQEKLQALVKEETTMSAPEAEGPVVKVREGRPAKPKPIDYENDTLLTAIAKLGGIHTSEKVDLIGDKTQRMQSGISHVFHKNGKDIDSMMEALHEQGYIPPEAWESDHGRQWFQEAIADEARGTNKYYSLKGSEDARYSRMRPDEAGKIDPTLLARVGGASAGAAIGATQDDDPVRGAVLGAAGGALVGGAAKRWTVGGYGSALNAALNPAAKEVGERNARQAVWIREATKSYDEMKNIAKDIPADRQRAVIDAIEAGNASGLNQQEKALAIVFMHARDEVGTAAQQTGVLGPKQIRPNHVPIQFDWDDPATAKKLQSMGIQKPTGEHERGFSTFTPHALTRTIDTYAQARTLGLKTKYDNLPDIWAGYANSMTSAIENKRLVASLANLKDANGAAMMVQENQLSRAQRLAGWKSMKDIAPKVEELHGMYVDPAIADSVKLGLASHDPETITRAAMATAWGVKRVAVSLSFFHANNLLQSIGSAMGPKGIPFVIDTLGGIAGKATGKVGVPYESAIDTAIKVYRSGDKTGTVGQMIDIAIRNGLKVGGGPIEEVAGRDSFHKLMMGAERGLNKVPMVGGALSKVPAGVRKVDEGFQKFTFDYVWTGGKLTLFNELYAKEVVRNEAEFVAGKAPRKDLNEIARTVATHVNSVAGGQDWQNIAETVTTKLMQKPAKQLAKPEAQAWEHILTLAPDWNISALQPWLRASGVSTSDKDLMRLSQNYVFWSTFYSMVSMNAIQHARTGTYTWENDFRPESVKRREGPQTPAQKLHDMTFIDWGDGTHLQVAKHWAEAAHLVAKPFQFAINKTQPVITEPIAMGLNKQYLSTEGGKPITKEREWGPRALDYLGWEAKQRAPIGVKQFSQGVGWGLMGIAGVNRLGTPNDE